MPIGAALASAAASIGGSLLSSNAANKANKNALNAQNQATDKQIAAQQAARDQILQLQSPFIGMGTGAASQLSRLYGYGAPQQAATVANPYSPTYAPQGGASGPQRLPPEGNLGGMERVTAGGGPNPFAQGGMRQMGSPIDTGNNRQSGPTINPQAPAYVGGVPQTTPGTPGTAAGPDWNAYIAQHPDVQQWIADGHGDPNLGPSQTPQQAAQYQYENSFRIGNPEPAPPQMAAMPGTPDTTQMSPADQALSQAVGQRPTWQTPNYGSAPDSSAYFGADKFHTDPGYQFAMSQGLRADNASYGARGLLKSDAAIKGLNDYAQGMANQQYGNWWNRQNTLLSEDRNQFNNDRSANYNIFNTDRTFGNNAYLDNREYATNRYDNTANNLFRTIGIGTGAAASVGGADTNYANAASGIYGAQGQNQANTALANGATQSQLYGSLGGAASNFLNLNSLGGGYQPIPTQTIGSAWGNGLTTNPFSGNANIVSSAGNLPAYY